MTPCPRRPLILALLFALCAGCEATLPFTRSPFPEFPNKVGTFQGWAAQQDPVDPLLITVAQSDTAPALGRYRVDADAKVEGDQVVLDIEVEAFESGWLEKVEVAVLPLEDGPPPGTLPELRTLCATASARRVEARDEEGIHRARIGVDDADLTWTPLFREGQELENTRVLVSVLLTHNGGALTRQTVVRRVIRGEQ